MLAVEALGETETAITGKADDAHLDQFNYSIPNGVFILLGAACGLVLMTLP